RFPVSSQACSGIEAIMRRTDRNESTPNMTSRASGATENGTLALDTRTLRRLSRRDRVSKRLPSGFRAPASEQSISFRDRRRRSLTTRWQPSSSEEVPHGMEFLYSRHHLNVATSRAGCICTLVANPKLLEPECRTPEQMRVANAFCRYLELPHIVR